MPNCVKYTIFVAFLKFVGCKKVSQKGSHEKYKKEGLIRSIIVPKKDMIMPTVLSSNLKTLGFTYQEFLKIVEENKLMIFGLGLSQLDNILPEVDDNGFTAKTKAKLLQAKQELETSS